MTYNSSIDRQIKAHGNEIIFRQLCSTHIPMHSHDSVQVIVPLEGSHFDVTWELENKEFETKSLSVNSVCLIPPLLRHEAYCTEGSAFINFNIVSSYIRDHIKADFDSQNDIFETAFGMEDRFLFQIARSIRQHFLQHPEDNHKYYDALFLVLGQHLINNYLKAETRQVLFNDYSQISCSRIQTAIAYIHHHLDRPICVEEVADEVGMSHYHFVRVFKETMGITPAKFHTQQRIERAKKLLKTGRPIIDVAYDLGFSSQAHFSNVFSKMVGVTPRKFAMGDGQ